MRTNMTRAFLETQFAMKARGFTSGQALVRNLVLPNQLQIKDQAHLTQVQSQLLVSHLLLHRQLWREILQICGLIKFNFRIFSGFAMLREPLSFGHWVQPGSYKWNLLSLLSAFLGIPGFPFAKL